jgi:hypothetical protein
VELGAAGVETRSSGEIGEDLIRKAIQSQRETRPFWTSLALIDDFLIEPAALGLRAILVATLTTGIAAVAGRSLQYDQALADCATAQGFWVLSLMVRVGLLVALRRSDDEIETSLALILGPGDHAATIWLGLRQVDPFLILGWFAMGRSACRRGEVGPISAVLLCGSLGLLEAAIRVGLGVVLGASMRLQPLTGA